MDEAEVDFEVLEEALRAGLHGRFAGLWVEDSGARLPDRIHVAIAGLPGEHEEAARLAMVQGAAGVDYAFHPVTYTEGQLQAFLAPLQSLLADADIPAELTGAGGGRKAERGRCHRHIRPGAPARAAARQRPT